ncbi:MAG: hypothetical protein Sapg2KO_48210 [Saprospiraceae bacterium]
MVMIGTAILFILLGASIKYGKLYFLIAGYNTMSAQEQEKYDIEGIATVFWQAMLGMGLLLIMGQIIANYLAIKDLEFALFFVTIIAGIAYLLVKVNSDKYKK